MGHHIDDESVGEEVYKPYLSCLSNNYSSHFNKTKKDEKFCNDKSTSVAACNSQVVKSHSGELIADQWGIRFLGYTLENRGTLSLKRTLYL